MRYRDQVGGETLSFKQRVDAIRNLPPFLKMVWKTNPKLTLINIFLRLIRSALPVALLYVGKLIIDEVAFLVMHPGHDMQNYNHLWQLVAIEFALAFISDGSARLVSLLDGLIGDLFANYSSIKIMEHAATLDLEQFEDANFYDKLERARQQTSGRTVLLSQMLGQVQDLISIVFFTTGLAVLSPWLIALLVVAVLPSFLSESYFNRKKYELYFGQTSDRRELDYVRYLGASDVTAKEVKVFYLADFLIDRFKTISNKFYEDSKQIAVRRSSWGTFFALIGSAGYYTAYVIIISQTIHGKLSLGDLTFMAGSFRQLRGLVEGVLTRFNVVSQGAMYLGDLFEYFNIKPTIISPTTPRPFPVPIREGFRFENVSFKYVHSEKWAVKDLNFTLPVGEKLALVGENGAGKTTLVKLLTRLYDPTEGRILLDGHDLREYDLQTLRHNVGIIFQDFLRYQMNFAQNIAVGNIREKENRELIKSAATQSLANLLAERLPGGYDQMLGKRFHNGIDLSGGEWQKIALARAYMKESQLLILDEPTSALDAKAEYEVFLRFADLTKGKTSVLISHRFSTVRMADRIMVLDKGKIIELGHHAELLARNGRYAELFNLQAMGYR
ncbi:ABC transporter ATP-binding protein [Chitinophaga caeni]|uniref:ABC transporter ATP-binding protein n=2 Tax=Chitinophaga caeni TaxID=2029983 RepID=A0A291R151_9BACT|nr:ABC transporter ATP-binding protein [Chitinophaga caeni]